MPSTINNEATTTYQFNGSPVVSTTTSNENTITLEDNQGLDITKTASPTNFSAGSIITYTVTITNNSGSYLSGVRIIDDLGSGNLAYVVGSGSLSSTTTYPVNPVSTNPLTFTLQQLNVGQSMTLTYRAQVIFNLPSSITSITNSVRGIGYTSNSTINGFATETIFRPNTVSVSSTKSSSLTEVFPRQNFSYYITLTNSGGTSATAISTTDQLPPNFVVTSVELRIGTGANITLDASEYELNGTNLLTVPSSTGPIVTIPAGGTSVITINGYFE